MDGIDRETVLSSSRLVVEMVVTRLLRKEDGEIKGRIRWQDGQMVNGNLIDLRRREEENWGGERFGFGQDEERRRKTKGLESFKVGRGWLPAPCSLG